MQAQTVGLAGWTGEVNGSAIQGGGRCHLIGCQTPQELAKHRDAIRSSCPVRMIHCSKCGFNQARPDFDPIGVLCERLNNITRLVYYETFDDIRDAIAREKQLKRWRREKKVWLIERENPEWRDLSENWYDDTVIPSERKERSD